MSPIFNVKDAIAEALTSLGGSGTVSQVRDYIKSKYGKDWKDIRKIMDDLCQESTSSFFRPEDKMLTKTGNDQYTLKETPVPKLPEVQEERTKPVSSFNIERRIFSFKGAEEILQKKGQLPTILQAASLTDLSSVDEHDKIQHFLHKNMWDVEVSLFPVVTYKLDAFKEKTAIEIERSLIDAVHRSLFRCLWAFDRKKLDVLVFIVPTYKEPKFEQVKHDLQDFQEIIPYPVYLIGVAQTQQ
jgi:hemerythrin